MIAINVQSKGWGTRGLLSAKSPQTTRNTSKGCNPICIPAALKMGGVFASGSPAQQQQQRKRSHCIMSTILTSLHGKQAGVDKDGFLTSPVGLKVRALYVGASDAEVRVGDVSVAQ